MEALKPDYVAPLVCFLGHEENKTNGGIFEVGSGWIARVRWQRAAGHGFPISRPLRPEDIRDNWEQGLSFVMRHV